MTKKPTNPVAPKSKSLVCLEYVLLGLCFCVIALRCTFTEGPPMQSTTIAANLGDSIYSLSVSAVLIFSFLLWIGWSFCQRWFSYRVTGIEIGLAVFVVAAVIAGVAAADRRLAITDVAVFLAPPIMALLLIQILDSWQKVRLVLVVVAALGVVSAYQCAEQFLFSNQLMIEQYEQEPEKMLEQFGIEPSPFPQFLFEHRLYSRGVRGFFTTRNSAGSSALMALFAAIALFADKLRNRKSDPSGRAYLLAGAGIAAVILLGLALTRSKGAFIGLFFAAAVFAAVRKFGGRLGAHRKAVLIGCLLLCVVGFGAVVSYGLKYDRLPGGGSMLVRWQYWHASGRMYADHKLTGVGPGNFGYFYPHYKPPAALESVADPHNFPLSILTQYGPLGLIGFLLMIFLPLWRLTNPPGARSSAGTSSSQPTFHRLAIPYLIVVSASVLLIRPILMHGAPGETFEVLMYLIVTLYVAPVAVFFIAFVLVAGPMRKEQRGKTSVQTTSTSALLFCAILAVALQNLIDFAIFEPGVLTVFWALLACLIATDSQTNPRPGVALKSAPFSRLLVVAAIVIAALAYLNYVLVPVAQNTAAAARANRAVSAGQYQRAHDFFAKAADADPLSAAAPAFNGRLYLRRFGLATGGDRDSLLRAAECLQVAIERNDAAFKNFERLTDTYVQLAETSTGRKKTDWLGKALATAYEAVNRYPGCGRLHFKLAQIAEESEKTGIAIEHYSKAIEIENAYRDQFRIMYPERKEIVSRLGEEMFRDAKQRLELLRKQSAR